MSIYSVLVILVGYTGIAWATPLFCSVADNPHNITVDDDRRSAVIEREGVRERFGSLTCMSSGADLDDNYFLSCKTTNVADAGFLARFYYRGITPPQIVVKLDKVTFAGLKPIAMLPCVEEPLGLLAD